VAGRVTGDLAVVFTPDVATDRLVFRLWPNGPRPAALGGRLEAGPVTVDGQEEPTLSPDPTTLVVASGRRFEAGRAVRVTIPWRLRLPGGADDRVSIDGGAIRLGSFFPILAWEPSVGWATEPATGNFAEASTATTADFDVTLEVPSGFEALASGVQDRPGHWTATAMRDVGVSIGRFTKATATAHAPEPVVVTVGVHAGLAESAPAYLQKVVVTLEELAARYGPYPWPTFTLALTPGLGGGIEYPGHVMQGPGTLGRTTSHEVGHQWFYALVGNNQGRDPWLDEGLATWTEAQAERSLTALVATAVPLTGRGRAGAPMAFWETNPGTYYRSVYVQGAQALAALGDPALVDCALRLYVALEAYDIGRPADLIRAAGAVVPDAAARLGRFGIGP